MGKFSNWFKIKILKQDLRARQLHPYIQNAIGQVVDDLGNFSSKCALSKKDIILFNEFGSDKDSRHSYGSTYFALLNGRSKPSILEIGVGSKNKYPYAGNPPGGGLLTFRKYIPDALLIGADIDPDAISILQGYGIVGFVVDQTSKSSLENLINELKGHGKFDLIIDDGLHEPHANVMTILQLFDLIKIGGHYVVEDVHISLINFWRLMALNLPGQIEILNMSEKRKGTNDNVLLVFHKSCSD